MTKFCNSPKTNSKFTEKPKSEISIRAKSAQSLQSQKSESAYELKEIIFNPDCLVGVLLDFIREEIGLEQNSNYVKFRSLKFCFIK